MNEQPSFPQPDPSSMIVPGADPVETSSRRRGASNPGSTVTAVGVVVAGLVASLQLLAGPAVGGQESVVAPADSHPVVEHGGQRVTSPAPGDSGVDGIDGEGEPEDSDDRATVDTHEAATDPVGGFEPASPVVADEAVVSDDTDVVVDGTTDDEVAGEAEMPSTVSLDAMFESTVEDFLDGFVDAHRRGDVKELSGTLHPSIKLAFGDETCFAYIAETAGSIQAARIVDVGVPRPLEMATPLGPIEFESAIPFTVEFLTEAGDIVTNPANLPMHDGEVRWLTTCGVTVE